MDLKLFGTLVFTTILALARIAGAKSPFFQAIAHLWVGGLFGYALATRETPFYLMAGALTLIEAIVFFVNLLLLLVNS